MNALLVALSLLVGVSISLTVPGGGAAVAVCACTAVVTWLLINPKGPRRAFLLRLFVGGLLVRVLVGTAIYVFHAQEFFGGDALTYDYQARLVLDFWGKVAPAGIADEMGNAGVGRGMVYLVAVIYSLTGPNMLAVQFFNAVLGAATALLIFFCAEHIYGNARVARTAALLVAFYSSLVLWSSQALKDGPIVFLLAAAMLATLKLGGRLRPSYLLVLVASMLATLSLRFYIFYMLAAAVAGSLVMGMRAFSAGGLARQFVVVVFAGLVLTYMGVLRTASTQMQTFGSLEAVQRSRADLVRSANTGFGRDVDVSTTSGALSAMPLGLAYLLFAPFPWQLSSLRQSITLPEMVVWWVSFPLLVLGIWFTLRHRMRQALPILLFTSMLTVAYSIFQGNVGTAYRQRSQILVFYFIFVAVGFVLFKERREERELNRRLLSTTLRDRLALRKPPPAAAPPDEAPAPQDFAPPESA